MNREDVFKKIAATMAEQLDFPEADITEESLFKEDLDADSLDLVELLLMMEEEYGFSVSDDEAAEILTVGQAVDLVMERAVTK